MGDCSTHVMTVDLLCALCSVQARRQGYTASPEVRGPGLGRREERVDDGLGTGNLEKER